MNTPADETVEENKPEEDSSKLLGAKIRHLIGVSGYRFRYRHCQDKKIAHYIRTAPASWTRMKNNKLKINVEQLGLLTEYFRLDADYGLTFEVFLCPTLGDFKAVLKKHRVGAYGAGEMDLIRSKLTAAKNARTDGISIERSNTRAGGLAGNGAEPDIIAFRPGETVTVRVSHPEGGYLLVLNDGPDKEIVSLMPSRLAPRITVRGKATRLPTDESPASVFSISSPSGRYRLYSIWSRKPFGLEFIRDALEVEKGFFVVPAGGLRELCAAIDKFDAIKDPPVSAYEVRVVDYYVDRFGETAGAP